jgi:predicted kinase
MEGETKSRNHLLVVVIFGLMGTGKTTLARALGEALHLEAIHSDAVRKTLAGMAPTERAPLNFGQGIYRAEFSERTYAEMRRLAAAQLAAGRGVILDASFKQARERDLARELAREHGARALFVYCECAAAVARERLGIRLSDPAAISDGRVELFAAQARDFDPLSPGDRPLLRLDTGRELKVVLAELMGFVRSYLPEAPAE